MPQHEHIATPKHPNTSNKTWQQKCYITHSNTNTATHSNTNAATWTPSNTTTSTWSQSHINVAHVTYSAATSPLLRHSATFQLYRKPFSFFLSPSQIVAGPVPSPLFFCFFSQLKMKPNTPQNETQHTHPPTHTLNNNKSPIDSSALYGVGVGGSTKHSGNSNMQEQRTAHWAKPNRKPQHVLTSQTNRKPQHTQVKQTENHSTHKSNKHKTTAHTSQTNTKPQHVLTSQTNTKPQHILTRQTNTKPQHTQVKQTQNHSTHKSNKHMYRAHMLNTKTEHSHVKQTQKQNAQFTQTPPKMEHAQVKHTQYHTVWPKQSLQK